MNKEELHRALTAYLPEEVEWKKKYLKSLADGELPACMVNDPMKILSDDSDERDTSLDYGTHYFEGLRNIALHRHWRYFTVSYHAHQYVEVMYMYDGSGTNYVEGVGCRMKKGDFCVISPKVYHIFENDGDSVLVNIIIKTDYIEHLFTDSFLLSHPFTDFMRQISGGTEYPKYLYVEPCGDGKITDAADELLCAYFEKSACVNWEIEALLTLLFSRIITSEKCTITKSELQYRNNSVAVAILSYIGSHLAETNLADTAEYFNYSKPYICRLIKESTGMTFSEYAAKLRINRACELLRHSQMHSSDVAFTVGYRSVEYFNRSFMRETGMSPNEYRKSQKT